MRCYAQTCKQDLHLIFWPEGSSTATFCQLRQMQSFEQKRYLDLHITMTLLPRFTLLALTRYMRRRFYGGSRLFSSY